MRTQIGEVLGGRYRAPVVAGGGAGAADFLDHGVEREALGAGDVALHRMDFGFHTHSEGSLKQEFEKIKEAA